MSRAPFAAADPASVMPDHPGARADAADAAVHVLVAEERRLGRIGLEPARARVCGELRFWRFVRAIHALADAPRMPRGGERA